jgi:hypothetical protein
MPLLNKMGTMSTHCPGRNSPIAEIAREIVLCSSVSHASEIDRNYSWSSHDKEASTDAWLQQIQTGSPPPTRAHASDSLPRVSASRLATSLPRFAPESGFRKLLFIAQSDNNNGRRTTISGTFDRGYQRSFVLL